MVGKAQAAGAETAGERATNGGEQEGMDLGPQGYSRKPVRPTMRNFPVSTQGLLEKGGGPEQAQQQRPR